MRNLNKNTFNGLTNLQDLHLSRNKISTINEKAFNGLINLRWLDLHDNQINTLNKKLTGKKLKMSIPKCEISLLSQKNV